MIKTNRKYLKELKLEKEEQERIKCSREAGLWSRATNAIINEKHKANEERAFLCNDCNRYVCKGCKNITSIKDVSFTEEEVQIRFERLKNDEEEKQIDRELGIYVPSGWKTPWKP